MPDEPSAPKGYLSVLLGDALDASGLDATPVEGFPGVMTGRVSGSIGQWDYFAQADEASLGVLVYSVYPKNAPEDRRQAMAELTARANYILRYGNLETDLGDGEIRVRTSARGGQEELEFHVVAELIRANFEVADLFFPIIQQVLDEYRSPDQALAKLLETLN